jgi:hypothetical protein
LCHPFLSDPRFLVVLLGIDRDLAEALRAKGCPCGGHLHKANYPRKPRGGPECSDPEVSLRFSFSCDTDGCRMRATPPSVRFLGRKVYLGVLVVLITAMRQGPTRRGYAELKAHFGADRRTIERWQRWWKEVFASSKFWQSARARIASLPEPLEFPRALVLVFQAESPERAVDLLEFLSPITASSRLKMQAF